MVFNLISSQIYCRINGYRYIELPFKIANRAIGYSVKGKTVNLSYASYETSEDSTQPPIFIFHGIIANKAMWEGIGKTILNLTQRRVVTVDLRNHGNSPHKSSHKYTDQANDVLQLLEKLGVRQASLIGHCMGGRTAMCVALIAPLKVAGLLVVDISPISTPACFKKHMPKIVTAMAAVKFKKTKRIAAAKSEARRQLNDSVTDEILMEDILSNIKIKSDGTIGWICNLNVLAKDHKYWTSFPKVSNEMTYGGPTLFIGGQLSEYIPADDLTDIRELFPRAVITYVKNTGHYVQIEDPSSFLGVTISFLKRHRYYEHKHSYNLLYYFILSCS